MAQYYTGLDVSMEQTDIVTVDDKGKIVFEASIKTNPQSIDAALKQAGFPIQKMSLESGSWSHWLVKEVSALGWNITCIDARSISPLLALKTNKTDRNDARGIAEAVRMQSQPKFTGFLAILPRFSRIFISLLGEKSQKSQNRLCSDGILTK